MFSRRNFISQSTRTGIALGLTQTPIKSYSYSSSTPFILFIHLNGGWDQTMVFDQKIGNSAFAQEPGWQAAKTSRDLFFVGHQNRPSVSSFFNQYGKDAAIINGVNCGAIDDKQAYYQMLSAVPARMTRRTDWLSIYANQTNGGSDIPHLVIDAPYLAGDFSSSCIRVTSNQINELDTKSQLSTALSEESQKKFTAFRNKIFRSRSSDTPGNILDNQKQAALSNQFLLYQSFLKNLGVLPSIKTATNESEFVRNAKIALEFFDRGVSQCATIQRGFSGEWDTRKNHFEIQSKLYENLFRDLLQIMSFANEKKLLKKILIVVMSERGRAPTLNQEYGKIPWPYTSVLLWSTSIRGNTIIGETDDMLRGKPIHPVLPYEAKGMINLEMSHLMMGLYKLGNVSSTIFFPDIPAFTRVLPEESTTNP